MASYTVNGKRYTDHALMDEIVYNCKLILDGILVKNDELANYYETKESIQQYEYFLKFHNGTATYRSIPCNMDILMKFGYDYHFAKSIMNDRENIPEADRNDLIEFSKTYFFAHFEEENEYYRTLLGLPEYGTTEYDIYLDRSDFPSDYEKEIDLTKPIHQLNNELISILRKNGKLDRLIASHSGSKYMYLRYLGDHKIDLYTARKARKWDILYMPYAESQVQDRFLEFYLSNREIYLKRTYSDAFSFNNDYYEQIMILLLLCQTFNDMVVDVPEWYIHRDIFDIRSVQYFLSSYGVAFYKEIPLRYQIRIVKSLNKLIKYKASNKNCFDIIDIFSADEVSIFKYYLLKKRIANGNTYVHGKSDSEKYELEFVGTKIGESYDDYIKDMIYRHPYDDYTLADKYWDGENTHEFVKLNHVNKDFTIEGTKYMSIEYDISMSDYLYQMSFFLGLLLDSKINFDDIKIKVPSIQKDTDFRVSDLFLLLILLTSAYYNGDTSKRIPDIYCSDRTQPQPPFTPYDIYDGGYAGSIDNDNDYNGRYAKNETSYAKQADGGYAKDAKVFFDINAMVASTPESDYMNPVDYDDNYMLQGSDTGNNLYFDWLEADGGNHVEYSEFKSVEDHYDWMKKKYPELFDEDLHKNHVIGFNSDADLDMIAKVIQYRHSKFHFEHGFTLEDLGVQDFHIPKEIHTIDELISVYKDNKKIYKKLKEKINLASNRDEAIVYEWVFDQLFTKPFDYNFYTLSDGTSTDSIDKILKDRNYILWKLYDEMMQIPALETRQDAIREPMDEIIQTLQFYLNDDELKYIFSFTATSSPSAMIHYIHLMVTFFKSYKVYFLDPSAAFIIDSKEENKAGAHYDSLAELKLDYWKDDAFFMNDSYSVTVERHISEDLRSSVIEVLDIFQHYVPLPGDDYDYDGKDATDFGDTYKDANGGIANDKKCYPFFVLNGGPGFGVIKDLWDLDGSNSTEKQGALDVDGGGSFHLEDIAIHSHCNHYHHYIINGGDSETDKFVRHSMHPKMIDSQDTVIMRISTMQFDKLTQNKEDGSWTAQEFESYWNGYEDLPMEDWYGYTSGTGGFESYSSAYNDLLDLIQIQSKQEIKDTMLQIPTKIEMECEPVNLSTIGTYEDSTYTDNGANTPYKGLLPLQYEVWNNLEARIRRLEYQRIFNQNQIKLNYQKIQQLKELAIWIPFEGV